MEYQVPQFIEIESKVVGTLTLRQFIYIAGGAGLCIVFFTYLQIIIALLLSAPVIALAVTLSFYKVNGKPFIEMMEAAFNYYTHSKLFLWKHREASVSERNAAAATAAAADKAALTSDTTPKLTRGKLSELAWSLDVQSPASSLQHPE